MKSNVQQRRAWTRAVRSILTALGDVAVVVVYVAVVDVAATYAAFPATIRGLVSLPLVFFLPGYALLSVLYPGEGEEGDFYLRLHGRGMDWTGRVVLSFGTSLVVLVVLGLALGIAGLGYGTWTVLNALTGWVVGGMVGGSVRRLRLPETERYGVPVERWSATLWKVVSGTDSRVEAGLNVALIAVVTLSLVTVAVAFAAPPSGETYSELTLLSESPEGELVTSNYPRSFEPGESRSLYVGIGNHEGEQTTYTVVAELQRVRTDGELEVLEQERLDRFRVTLAPGETVRRRRSVAPTLTGENLRLVYHLYRDEAPADPGTGSAYRSTYIWISVGEG